MIKRLEVNLEGLSNNQSLTLPKWQFQNLIDKINEIIDHLPQEKECKCVYESDCHGIEMIKSPSGKEWAIGGTNTQDRMISCPWCGGKLPKGTYKQPTKEVPDIRIVDTNILWQKLQDRGFDHVQASEAIKVIQEISALYRKEGGL